MDDRDRTMRERAVAAERMEAQAWVDWYASAPPAVRASGGQRVASIGGATLLIAPGLPVPLFNRVIGLGLDRPCTPDDLEAVRAVYRDAGVKAWTLQWNPLAAPADLPDQARAMGFAAPSSRWAKMWRGDGAVPEADTDLSIGEVGAAAAPAWAEAVAEGYGSPGLAAWLHALHGRAGWRPYAALDGDRAAGGGALYLDGAQAWLGMGAMRPDLRHRHGHRALIARRVADALACGATSIFTETGEPEAGAASPSLDNMRHCGFSRLVSRINLPGPVA
jgi:hypothetical protein